MVEIDGFGVAIAAFIVITLAVGIFAGRMVRHSGKRLIVAGKSLPLAMVGTMLAAQAVDGNSSLGNIALVFEFGFWAGAAIPIGLGVCLLVVSAFYAKPLNKMSMITLPDFYFRRFGNGAEGISGILMIISFLILVAGNLAASGFILEVVFGIDYFYGIAISALVVVAYTVAGGLFASAYTNLFQVYLAIGSFWAAFLFFFGGYSAVPWDVIYSSAPPEFLDLSGLFDVANGALINWGAILALGLGDIIALDFMERIFSARDPKTAKRSSLMGGALTLFTVIPTSMLGIVAVYYIDPSVYAGFTPDLALPLLATEFMPFVIGAAILMGVIGASMSTASGGLLAISSVVSRNLMQRIIRRRWMGKPSWSDSKLLVVTRIVIVPMMIAGVVIGYLVPAPGVYLVLAFDIVFAGALAPLTFGLFWKKANMPAAVASLLVGSFLRLSFFFIFPADLAGLDTMIAPAVSFILFIVVALATQNRYPGKARHDVRDYVPPEEDVITGEDLKHFKGGEEDMSNSSSNPPGSDDSIASKNVT